MLLLSRLSYQCPSHSWMLLCRHPHPVTSVRMSPRKRLISCSPRYLLPWECRRLPTVFTPCLWMLPCRRSHTVHCFSMFLHRWGLAQLPRFLLMCLSRLPYAVRCYTMLPYNYRSRRSLLAVSFRAIPLDRQNFVRQSPSSSTRSTCFAAATARTRTARPAFWSQLLVLTCTLHMALLL